MNILYIEDDKQLAATIKQKLKTRYNICVAKSGQIGINKLENREYDVIVIDYYLPDMNGVEVCRSVREIDSETPILMFTTNESRQNIVKALDSGADDYLTKPFSFDELEARLRALIRRNRNKQPKSYQSIGEMMLSPNDSSIIYGEQTVKLPRQEYLLLKYLIGNKGKIISREELYEHVWGTETYYNSNTIDVHIRRLRNRLRAYSKSNLIKSVYGFGYKIDNTN